jgi:hypothetical protein
MDAAHPSYFEAVEEIFIRLRGAPLLLSPADWQVARRWHREGVPLDLVRRTLEEVFARRRERGARGRIQSLRYCAPAIDAAWEEVRELRAPGERALAAPLDVAARLAALAAALPADLPRREAWARRIAAAEAEGRPEAIEERLVDLDRELLEMAAGRLDDETRLQLGARAAASLKAVAGRLPADEVEVARRRLERRLLRRELGLPVLSLFAPEAEAGERPTGDAASAT